MTTYLIVTSIAAPTNAMLALSHGARENDYGFICIGDNKSPADFSLDTCEFYSVEQQKRLGFEYAKRAPENHYARKNLGYLIAIQNQADSIVETDDDNAPMTGFWEHKTLQASGRYCDEPGWVNAYQYFSNEPLWPRGFPLEAIKSSAPQATSTGQDYECPIQQGLADGDPDVDAVYRFVGSLPVTFDQNAPLILGKQSWCPFNSQNTVWHPQAYALMYLPATCSFRMTDIWRSYIAQACLWPNDWHVLFHSATVFQDRNEHEILKDFADEVSGYLNAEKIRQTLQALDLKPGSDKIAENMRACYAAMTAMGLFASDENELLELWLKDIDSIQSATR